VLLKKKTVKKKKAGTQPGLGIVGGGGDKKAHGQFEIAYRTNRTGQGLEATVKRDHEKKDHLPMEKIKKKSPEKELAFPKSRGSAVMGGETGKRGP